MFEVDEEKLARMLSLIEVPAYRFSGEAANLARLAAHHRRLHGSAIGSCRRTDMAQTLVTYPPGLDDVSVTAQTYELPGAGRFLLAWLLGEVMDGAIACAIDAGRESALKLECETLTAAAEARPYIRVAL